MRPLTKQFEYLLQHIWFTTLNLLHCLRLNRLKKRQIDLKITQSEGGGKQWGEKMRKPQAAKRQSSWAEHRRKCGRISTLKICLADTAQWQAAKKLLRDAPLINLGCHRLMDTTQEESREERYLWTTEPSKWACNSDTKLDLGLLQC